MLLKSVVTGASRNCKFTEGEGGGGGAVGRADWVTGAQIGAGLAVYMGVRQAADGEFVAVLRLLDTIIMRRSTALVQPLVPHIGHLHFLGHLSDRDFFPIDAAAMYSSLSSSSSFAERMQINPW